MPRQDEATAKGRILVVDDQPDMCWVLAKLLSQRGHDVRTAATGVEALAALAGSAFDVVVVDYRLPDANGIALIAELTARVSRLQGILMTSYGNESLRLQAAAAHLFAYFDKPFSNDLMVHTIEEAVRAPRAGDDSSAAGSSARTRFPSRTTSAV